ncbi:hypothetical protein BWQ96_07668 [Gracilariopsis chorda]|uniref:Uncharacterized protein n=1 Tax=Gracilariopsis chorda TaxID=448386 RepID=A0A2V3IKP5_9FLOR|nr:hypothetical protein BWQ96_07668 [Gracilariopsis chorda]|eukprot:PXF42618.1 hypothetical protein BWQ96_07668 [Gracilariopsis chorda]
MIQPSLLAALVLLVVVPQLVFAQQQTDDSKCVFRTFGHTVWPVPRYFSMSDDAPAARYYRQNEDDGDKMKRAFKFVQKLVEIMDKRRDKNHPDACNLHRDLQWVRDGPDAATKREVVAAGRGGLDDTCPSRLDFTRDQHSDPELKKLAADSMSIIKDVVHTMPSAMEGPQSPSSRGLRNWTEETHQLADWDLRRLSQTCELQTISAYRIDGTLHMLVDVTNRPVDQFVFDYERQLYMEWVRDDFKGSMKMTQPRLIPKNATHDDRGDYEKSTTILTKWGGKLNLASHGEMTLDKNPAIKEALRQNTVAIDLAEDAITPSNIAILALPLTMNLIPVAFLAELSTFAMLAYIIFTDVFSTLPFLVKGVELINSVDHERRETVAFYLGTKEFGEIEVWAASCKGDDRFHAIGVAFVVIAVAAIIVGVLFEAFATMLMRRRRRKEGSEAEGPFGRVVFDITKMSLLGSGMDADDFERRYSIDAADFDRDTEDESQASSDTRSPTVKKWLQWGSHDATLMSVKVVPNVEHDGRSAKYMSRDASAQTQTSGDTTEEEEKEKNWFSRQWDKLLIFLGLEETTGDGGDFGVGVGSDGMSSAERAARDSGSDGYSYRYDMES